MAEQAVLMAGYECRECGEVRPFGDFTDESINAAVLNCKPCASQTPHRLRGPVLFVQKLEHHSLSHKISFCEFRLEVLR